MIEEKLKEIAKHWNNTRGQAFDVERDVDANGIIYISYNGYHTPVEGLTARKAEGFISSLYAVYCGGTSKYLGE